MGGKGRAKIELAVEGTDVGELPFALLATTLTV
jgi:hypothetical protein